VLHPQTAAPHPGAAVLLPVNYWNNGEFEDQLDFNTLTYTTLSEMFARDVSTPKAREYVSPDGSVFLPAVRVFQQGPADSTGWRFSDNLDTYGFIAAHAGQRIYVSSESEDRTYSALVNGGRDAQRSAVFCRPRRRKRCGRWRWRRVCGQRANLCLQRGRKDDRTV
jgi:hypothetical protein